MNAFVEMRKFLAVNGQLFERLTNVEYKLLEHEKKDIEYKLKETKNQRRANKTLEYLENITPQHVSGRVYKVNDGDAFGTFCLWFCIIGTVIVLIYVLISGDI